MLRLLDLFSGIGGFSFALESVAKTIGYCDIEMSCRDVINNNINRGLLQKAMIYNDIRDIDQKLLLQMRPTLITAGFPCTDISSANPYGKGLKGKRSGLFHEIVRIVDECPSIKYVFMENSPRIIDKGFRDIRNEMVKRGFQIKYTLISAKDVGALHKRLRWYCLCYRDSSDLKLVPNEIISKYPWRKTRVSKIVRINSPYEKTRCLIRCKMLGNSIVPQCARYAWNLLVTDALHGDCIRQRVDFISPLRVAKKQNLVFSDGVNTSYADYWATPCQSLWHNYTHLNKRGIKVLSSQLFYSTDSLIEEADKRQVYNKYFSNPVFVEYLMGYPTNWTKTS